MNSEYGPIPGKPMGHSGMPGQVYIGVFLCAYKHIYKQFIVQFPSDGGPPTSIPMPGPTNPGSSMSMLNGMNGPGSEPGMEVMPKVSNLMYCRTDLPCLST